MSVLEGPGEGTWSVFAMKIVEERDALREKVASLEAELACAKAFHDVAVKERNLACFQLDAVEKELAIAQREAEDNLCLLDSCRVERDRLAGVERSLQDTTLENAALKESRDKWELTASRLHDELERLYALLYNCHDHIMSQHDPEDSVKLLRRIEETLYLKPQRP